MKRIVCYAVSSILLLSLAACTSPPVSTNVTSPPPTSTSTTPTTPEITKTYALPGAMVFPEGVAYDPTSNSFFVGSTNDGTIFRGNLANGQVSTFSAGGLDGRTAAIGMKVDSGTRRLWVAGGATGLILVYNVDTGSLVRKYETPQVEQTFLNDIALAPNGDACITDSMRPVLFKIDGAGAQPGELESWLDFTNSPVEFVPGTFALNGIVISQDSKYIVVVHSTAQKLFRITVATKEIREVDLGASQGGDGMVLDGQTLYVLTRTQDTNMIVRIEMAVDFSSGTIIDSFRDDTFAYPTTIAKVGDRMLVVNSQFDKRGTGLQPVLPFKVSDIPIPALSTTPPQTGIPDSVKLRLMAEGFVSPVDLIPSPDGTGRLFVVDQVGVIWVLSSEGNRLTEPFLDISSKMVTLNPNYDERGLLGLVFHPSFKENGRLFIYYSAPLRSNGPQGWNHTSHISEFKVMRDNPNKADPASERIILQVDEPQSNHNAGCIVFGPDGYLYIPLGDGGAANDVGLGHSPSGNGQDTSTLLGKILRIDVDKGEPYAIPSSNPFVGKEGEDEIFALGFRNPFRISFDMGGQRELFVADVGQGLWEEVSIVTNGGNYGWHIKEGSHWFNPDNSGQSLPTGPNVDASGRPLIDPIIEYGRGEPGGFGIAVIGGFVYRGAALPELHGAYIFGDLSASNTADGRLFVATRPTTAGEQWTMKELSVATAPDGHLNSFLRSIGQDAGGELYVLVADQIGPSGSTGKVYKIVP